MRLAFAQSVVDGLSAPQRSLSAALLHDPIGSDLTGAEDRLLAQHATTIRAVSGADTLIELGRGSSTRTRHLLDTGFRRYLPIDISTTAVREAGLDLARRYPALQIEGLATPHQEGLAQVASLENVLLSFPGSSMGDLPPAETDDFLEQVAATLRPGSALLLGVDKVEDPTRLEAACNDLAGRSAAFTRNLFTRMNAELGTNLDLDSIEHVAYFDDRLERIEIYGRFLEEVRIDVLGQRFRIAAGEMVRTGISRTYRPHEVAADARRFGFELLQVFEDADFGILLLQRRATSTRSSRRETDLRRLLQRVRSHTFDLLDALDERQATEQHSPLMSPLVWDVCHIAAFEELWLHHNLRGPAARIDPTVDPDLHPRPTRGALVLPTVDDAVERLIRTRRTTLGDLGVADTAFAKELVHGGYVYRMVAQHEAQHQETMLQAIQLRTDAPIAPAFTEPAPARPDAFPSGMVHVPAGAFHMGTSDRTVAYDNERPAHPVELEAFDIDATPVTNGAYLAFIEAGGYRDPQWWTPEGWAWVAAEQAEAPLFWQRDGLGWSRRVFSEHVGLDLKRPVIHVSWYEADAYARWAGKRLPTEAEWEKAAAWDGARRTPRTWPWGETPPGANHGNLGQRHLMTTPVGSFPDGKSFYGCHQMLGDVWEWTSSWFDGYPGFEAWPYPEYSEAFFGETYRVLRGASFATRTVAARNTFRNWDLPQRRQIFAGFRCARDC